MNKKACLASFVVVALALATAGCKTTERYDGSYPNVGAGEILVPMIKWGF